MLVLHCSPFSARQGRDITMPSAPSASRTGALGKTAGSPSPPTVIA